MYVIPPVEDWLRDFAGRVPYDIEVQSGARTAMQVHAAHDLGQSNARKLWETPHGPRIWHGTVVCCAVDVLVVLRGIVMEHDCLQYEELDYDAKVHGLTTGRDWKSPAAKRLGDFGHIEFPGWNHLPYAGHWPDDSHLDFSDVLAGSSSCSAVDGVV